MIKNNEFADAFLSGYFNQDWDADYESPDDVVRGYFRDHDEVDELIPVADVLRALADSSDDDARLTKRLNTEFQCSFYPPGVGLTTRDWLRHIVELFDEEIARHRRKHHER